MLSASRAAGAARHLHGRLSLRQLLVCSGLCLFVSAAFLCATFFIDGAVRKESAKMLYALHLRAESLAWALEGAVRFMGRHKSGLPEMLVEMGRQPGVAWIAIVNPDGRIVMDSNSALAGRQLYTPTELAALSPGLEMQSHFSPDDSAIYESWKLFSPGRLGFHDAAHGAPYPENNIVFVALNAANFAKSLHDYRFQLWLTAFSASFALLAVGALAFYVRNYLLSRKRLQEVEAVAEQIIQSYPAALIAIDPAENVMFMNKIAAAMLGRNKTSGFALSELGGLDWKGIVDNIVHGKGVFEREFNLARKSGPDLPVSVSGAEIRDSGGKLTGWLLVVANLENIKQLQKSLEESRRFSELGKLASGLSHEIRNPLGAIRGYACYLEQKLAADPIAQATARLLLDETERLNNVTTDLLVLARKPGLKPVWANLQPVLERAALVAKPDAETKGVDLKLSCPNNLRVFADCDRLLRALLNLILNAIQATPPGGKVEIGAEMPNPDAPETGKLPAKSCRWWRIWVRDNGEGIGAGDIERIFTPYFTTKAQGTGLGLAIARQITEAHGGRVAVSSLPGKGSLFSIYLPCRVEA